MSQWKFANNNPATSELHHEAIRKLNAKEASEITTLDELKRWAFIALIADTGMYWTRYGEQGIRVAKREADEFCIFTFNVVGDNVIRLIADNGNYLTRWGEIHGDPRSGQTEIQEIRAAKASWDPAIMNSRADQFCNFTIARDVSDTGFTLKGDNNRYVTRYGAEELRIIKEQPDQYCVFRIMSA